ncbi:MAG: hypothetical protein EHM61_08900 [Acidobacteria bacterium]|nr:MAG: hypothetical protein EHM61_08900 [Acidobacteriota bacterium]
MEVKQYSLPKAAFMGLLLLYGISGGLDPQRFWLLNGVDLAFHEFGHLAFGFLGEFIQFAGGTLMQLLIPIGIAVHFYRRDERYSAAATLFWIGQNLFNIAVYVGDARAQVLPLVGGGIHDWAYMLGRLNLLQLDTTLANLLSFLGWVLMLASVGFGLKFARHNEEEFLEL